MDKKLTQNELKLLRISSVKVEDVIQLSGKPTTNFQEFLKKFFTKKTIVFSLLLFIGLIITALIVKFTSKYDANKPISDHTLSIIANRFPSSFNDGWEDILIETDLDIIKWKNLLGSENFKLEIEDGITVGKINITKFISQGSSKASFILGTNAFGQDNWTRAWVGLLESIKLALFVSTIEFIIGFTIGAFIGFHAGSKLDNYFMRILDTIWCIPPLIWFILLTFIFGTSFFSLSLALISIGWIGPVYLTRMYILKVKDLEYIQAAKTIGVPKYKLLFKHAVPNVLGRILSAFVRRIPYVIFAQASLAFLGLVSSEAVDLGAVINDSRANLDNWLNLLVPTLIIFTLTLSVQFIANGINDALETKGVK